MTSRLFHAVVGVGISLGSVTGCGGSTVDGTANASPEGGKDAPDPPPAAIDGGADALPEAAPVDAAPLDAAPEASPDDATVDASGDAIVAAFCDVAWPITKSGREVCGPADECMGQAIPWCYGPDNEGFCKLYPLECVGAEWHCMGGVTPTTDPGALTSCQW